MKRVVMITLVVGLFLAVSAYHGLAGSQVPFPEGWEKWTPVKTPLAKIGALPGCDADVSNLPPIYQETVATYCGVKPGGPGKVEVLVNPGALKAYKARNGGFPEGPNMVLHLKDMKVLFVIGHRNGKALYGVFTEDGKDITAAQGPLSQTTCINCHTGYRAFCVKGQCGKIIE